MKKKKKIKINKRELFELIDDMGIETILDYAPEWVIDLAKKIIEAGWHK